jgi:MoaD family protein
MTKVLFRTYGHPTHIVGGGQVDIEFRGVTVKDLIDELIRTFGTPMRNILYPKGDKFSDMLYVLINGNNMIYLDGLASKLKDGDIVAVLPITAGG